MTLESGSDPERDCLICHNTPFDVLYTSCAHGAICHQCAIQAYFHNDSCFICRQKIESMVRIRPKTGLLYEGYP